MMFTEEVKQCLLITKICNICFLICATTTIFFLKLELSVIANVFEMNFNVCIFVVEKYVQQQMNKMLSVTKLY